MKNKKWLWVTLTALLTLIVLAVVAAAGFRLGAAQSAALIQRQDFRAQKLNSSQNTNNGEAVNPHGQEFNQIPNEQMYNPHAQGFDSRLQFERGFNNERGFSRRGEFFSPLFGLLHLLILGAALWLIYKLVKNSGWRLIHVAQPAPVTTETKNTD